jgi:pantothenate synthetase
MSDMGVESEIAVFSIPREIQEATSGLAKEFRNILLRLRNQDNALTIDNYLLSMKYEVNSSDNYRITTIKTLVKLSNFVN